jgi:hypothetical protein
MDGGKTGKTGLPCLAIIAEHPLPVPLFSGKA